MKTPLTQLLQIEHPIIMAPMFLVSNVAMVKAAMQAGIAGCIPALNYRTLPELREAITELKAAKTENGALHAIQSFDPWTILMILQEFQ